MTEDRIDIRDLLVRGIIGIEEWERKNRQDMLINISLFADLREAGAQDDLGSSVNYRTIAKQVIAHVESAQRFTGEALAAAIARSCLAVEREIGDFG